MLSIRFWLEIVSDVRVYNWPFVACPAGTHLWLNTVYEYLPVHEIGQFDAVR